MRPMHTAHTAHTGTDVPALILALERAALDRWGRGDPSGYLEISAPDVVYVDPFVERPVHGLDALRAYYAPFRGLIRIDRDEILNATVQHWGETAVLTYDFHSWGSETERRWHCTEVYRLRDGAWRIVQTHWSLVQPLGPPAA